MMQGRDRAAVSSAVLLALACQPVSQDRAATPVAPASDAIILGERQTLRSDVLGEDRPYLVALPESYGRSTTQAYPVLYLLDGDAHFKSASGVVQFMSAGINGNLQIPELILVAVPNTDRTRDLTPTHTTVGYDGKPSEMLGSSGGGDAFLRFFRDELMPEIEAEYRTQPYRILVGHSFGGLLALHALLEVPELFQSYIAIDPSLWWDEQRLVKRAAEVFHGAHDRRGAVYISLANSPTIGDDPPPFEMEASGRQFGSTLAAAASSDFRVAVQYFQEEDHGSVPLLSLYHGLLHVFHGYKLSLARVVDDPMSLAAHYEAWSQKLGYRLDPPEGVVDQLGSFLLYQMGEVDKAIRLLELNVENYPQSANAWGSLGEALAQKGDVARAIESCAKAVELDPESDTARQRLAALRERSGS